MANSASKALSIFNSWTYNEPGMCLKETRSAYAIGSKYGNATEAWNATKHKHSGDTTPPVGAPVWWTGGSKGYGHVAIYAGNGNVRSTDAGGSGKMGTKPLSWFASAWGLKYAGWSEDLNGVMIPGLGSDPDDDPWGDAKKYGSGDVYLSKLKYGQKDSDSVRRLQFALNQHPLTNGSTLPITGNYLDQTDREVRLCQQQHKYGNDPVKKSYVGPKQASHLFGSGYRIINDL